MKHFWQADCRYRQMVRRQNSHILYYCRKRISAGDEVVAKTLANFRRQATVFYTRAARFYVWPLLCHHGARRLRWRPISAALGRATTRRSILWSHADMRDTAVGAIGATARLPVFVEKKRDYRTVSRFSSIIINVFWPLKQYTAELYRPISRPEVVDDMSSRCASGLGTTRTGRSSLMIFLIMSDARKNARDGHYAHAYIRFKHFVVNVFLQNDSSQRKACAGLQDINSHFGRWW